MYDLSVAYRIYPKVSKPAHGLPFDNDKLRQSEICLRSFKKSLGNLKVKVWAILDNCPVEYEDLFRRYFEPEDLVLINMDQVGNARTFAKQVDILLQQNESDVVYFAEDDYLYVTAEFSALLRFLAGGKDVEFISAFDHPDDYYLDFHDFPKWLQIYEGRHWRNAASTCLTFLTTKSQLAKYESTFRSFERRNYDTGLWVSITKYRIFNIFQLIHYLIKGNFLWRVLVKSWFYSAWQNIFGQQAKLWIPIPSYALHLDRHHIAPGYDLAALLIEENRTLSGIKGAN